MRIRTYSELSSFNDFEDRYNYLRLRSHVGVDTFGFDRYLNQAFYTSSEWRRVRQQVILRDEGCDLGVYGYEIYDKILIHHMNPITVRDVKERNLEILNPEYLICCTHRTHNAIHYGDASLLNRLPPERHRNDTKLW